MLRDAARGEHRMAKNEAILMLRAWRQRAWMNQDGLRTKWENTLPRDPPGLIQALAARFAIRRA